jgi:LysM repeat protein
MSTMGRVIVTMVGAAVLVAATVLVMHYVMPPDAAPPLVGAPAAAGSAAQTAGAEGAGAGPNAAQGATATGDPKAGPAGGPDPAQAAPGAAAAEDGMALMSSGRLFQAQVRLSEALRGGIDGPRGKAVREALISLANRTQLSGQRSADDIYSKSYPVARGDSVTSVGQKFLVPPELVMKLNGLASPGIVAGQSLKVIQGPVNIEIYKSRHELQAWLGDVCIRVYPIGLGKSNSTPQGTFVVKSKMKNPPYQPQHKPRSEHREPGAPDNPLGARWIDIGNHYGIHGTIDPTTIGGDASEGCIRMNNKDVEELFDLVVAGATKVIIRL